MNKIAIAIFALLVGWGCGKEYLQGQHQPLHGESLVVPKGYTRISFGRKSSNGVTSAALGLGMNIYAINADTGNKLASENFPSELNLTGNANLLTLPNGNWKFFGYGKNTILNSASHLAQSINVQCAIANNGDAIALSGGTQSIDLAFSSTTCNNNIFAASKFKAASSLQISFINLCTTSEFASCTSYPCSCSSFWSNGEGASPYGLLVAATTVPLATYPDRPSTAITSYAKVMDSSDASIKTCITINASASDLNAGYLPLGDVAQLGGKSPFSLYFAVIKNSAGAFSCTNIATGTYSAVKQIELLYGLDFELVNAVNSSNIKILFNNSVLADGEAEDGDGKPLVNVNGPAHIYINSGLAAP